MTNKYQCIQLRIQDFFLGGPLPTPPQKKKKKINRQQQQQQQTLNSKLHTSFCLHFTYSYQLINGELGT